MQQTKLLDRKEPAFKQIWELKTPVCLSIMSHYRDSLKEPVDMF